MPSYLSRIRMTALPSLPRKLETELAHTATFDKYRAVLKGLNASNLAQTRTALAELQKQPIPELQNRIRELSSKLDAYETDKKLSPGLGTLDTLAEKHDNLAKSSVEDINRSLPSIETFGTKQFASSCLCSMWQKTQLRLRRR